MSDSGRHSPDTPSLAAQLRAERARSARLAAELLVEQEKVRQLESAFNHKDNETWHQHETIETLKTELRSIANMASQLQQHILASPPASALPSGPPAPALVPGAPAPASAERSAAAEDAQINLQVALMDLEDRLQQAVTLVLDELNTRKAAEARIQELEAQLAAVRRRIGGGE